MTSNKPVHSIILDAGPILKNEPSISTLLTKSEQLLTIPSVISEIKDANARSRVENTLLPFLTVREPNLASINIVTDFARKTGDLGVLSSTDLAVLALAYEVECERNGGDWRLRRIPGQKTINGPIPPKEEPKSVLGPNGDDTPVTETASDSNNHTIGEGDTHEDEPAGAEAIPSTFDSPDTLLDSMSALQTGDVDVAAQTIQQGKSSPAAQADAQVNSVDQSESDESGSDGWITPSNLKKRQAQDASDDIKTLDSKKTMQVATVTTDYAMQNVLLQMGLNLLSPSIQQVRHIRTYILRCHACFEKTKDMTKQFCPRCGKPTLTRVSCSTNAKGEFQIHLKKNMQWNHRGDRFSIPKPTPGTASGKSAMGKGGGRGGWGQELILAEDQKEYIRAIQGESRRKEKNLMDEDYLPSILTGDRNRAGGRPKVGAGRNVNSKKRR